MRRSAAPSQKGPTPPKKALFVLPFLSKKINNDSVTVSCSIIIYYSAQKLILILLSLLIEFYSVGCVEIKIEHWVI